MHIGNVEINSQLYLAPMAGVTDMAFRQICRELGAGMSCTELVSAKALCYQDKKSRGLLKLAPNERPAAAQIFGSDIPCMAEAAVIASLPYAPTGLNPLENPEGCKKRQLLVLAAMHKYGMINQGQLAEAKAEKIRLTNGTVM